MFSAAALSFSEAPKILVTCACSFKVSVPALILGARCCMLLGSKESPEATAAVALVYSAVITLLAFCADSPAC